MLAASKAAAIPGSGKIVGISINYGVSPPAIRRLTTSNDPSRLVTVNIMTEPVPAVGTGAGSSPFDSIYPWSMMEEWNVVDGNITVKRGHPDFSRTAHDTVVFLPPFWYCVMDDPVNNLRYYYVSSEAVSGFSLHPGSGCCVGKYEGNSNYESRSGFSPIAKVTRPAGRTGYKARGEKYGLFAFAPLCAVQLLYLLEFASWDAQAVIGRGNVDNASGNPIKTGSCDAMAYHTGQPEGADGKTGVQYRGIENLWGNTFEWVDGLNSMDSIAYVCTDPASFADNTDVNYIKTGVKIPTTGNWITGYGYSADAPWALIPNAATGSASSTSEESSIGDQIYVGTGTMCFRASGGNTGGSKCGLFYFNTSTGSSYSAYNLSVRLGFYPTESEIERMQSASDKTDTGVGDATIEPVRPSAENV